MSVYILINKQLQTNKKYMNIFKGDELTIIFRENSSTQASCCVPSSNNELVFGKTLSSMHIPKMPEVGSDLIFKCRRKSVKKRIPRGLTLYAM